MAVGVFAQCDQCKKLAPITDEVMPGRFASELMPPDGWLLVMEMPFTSGKRIALCSWDCTLGYSTHLAVPDLPDPS